MKAITFGDDGRRTPTVGDVPTELADEAGIAREALIELVAEADDSLMEKFFEAGTLTQAELEAGLRTATAGRQLFPLVCTSAITNLRIQPLLDAILAYVPSPVRRTLSVVDRKSGEPAAYDPGDSTAAALVWEDDRGPLRGTYHDVPRGDGDVAVGLDDRERQYRNGRTSGQRHLDAGQDAARRRGAQGG